MHSIVMKLLKDESGTTSVEYAIIVSLIAGAIIVVAYVLGGKTTKLLETVTGNQSGF